MFRPRFYFLSTCLLNVAAKFDVHGRVLFRVSAWTVSWQAVSVLIKTQYDVCNNWLVIWKDSVETWIRFEPTHFSWMQPKPLPCVRWRVRSLAKHLNFLSDIVRVYSYVFTHVHFNCFFKLATWTCCIQVIRMVYGTCLPILCSLSVNEILKPSYHLETVCVLCILHIFTTYTQ